MLIIFYIASAVAIISTLLVITQHNLVHALLYLVVSFLAVAMVFYVLGAPFIAALEVIIYAGAIVVLMIFVIMMLNLRQESVEQEKKWLDTYLLELLKSDLMNNIGADKLKSLKENALKSDSSVYEAAISLLKELKKK